MPRDRNVCPVGFCDPRTALPIEVPGPGEICDRHWPKISGPLAHQLQGARARGDQAEVERVLAAAIAEARRHDDHWHPWAIVDRERVEVFDVGPGQRPISAWRKAVERYVELREHDLAPAIVAGGIADAGILSSPPLCLPDPWIWARCPWRVLEGGVEVASSWHPGRPADMTPLGWAIAVAYRVPARGDRVVVNDWSGASHGFAHAVKIASRGQGIRT